MYQLTLRIELLTPSGSGVTDKTIFLQANMLGSVKPKSLELRTDSFAAATTYPEVCLVQVSSRSRSTWAG